MLTKLTRIFALVLAAFSASACVAQTASTPFGQASYYASSFGAWSINSQQPNTYTFQGRSICSFSGQGAAFFAFNTNAPVWIADQVTANSEVVTPTAVVNTAGSCGITASAVNQHYTFQLRSGTAGLQEALNAISGSVNLPVEIILDRNWRSQADQVPGAGASAIINSVTGNTGAYLLDITTAPNTYYSWNGTHFTPSATNVTPPTVAAVTGAGTGPTISLVGNGTTGIVTLTTGTTPAASASIFTLTWPSIANGGFQYAPNCTVASIGTRAYKPTVAPTTTSVAGPPAVATYTASTTALTASVSGYQFKYTCR